MSFYRQLQEESRAWVAHNFPNRHPLEPVLGLIEECGEFYDHADPADEADALADITIFAADACNGYALDLDSIIEEAFARPYAGLIGTKALLSTLGKIAHHALKDKQSIRGTHAEHVAAIRAHLVDLFTFVRAQATTRAIVLSPLVESTWKKVVQKRDWRPPVGHTTVDGPNPMASTR
jgi:hypothetical protein